ncbi:MAG: hypothetical protein Q4D71_14425 [Oscillospiraceae bacterium]|nr:hypothetical protein [Oscillospiraceae bacterium]
MKCTFYRPERTIIREFQNIVGKMRLDLHDLKEGKVDEQQTRRYVLNLMRLAEPLERNPRMMFWGLDRPERMPSDARVDFFYIPSYIATAILMRAALTYPALIGNGNDQECSRECTDLYKKVLPGAMLGCTGRGFMGSGYDDVRGLFDTMEIFSDGGAGEFVKLYPDMCPEFTKLYTETVSMIHERVAEEKWQDGWGADYLPRAERILSMTEGK